ncbi:MAG: hypothetical protein HYY55_02780 [Candidatus Niyogibacteria bacterium]|nr:MAG: hypothetical protein HYY55_02780 [Candidatus Niyogibacteria bacterium]
MGGKRNLLRGKYNPTKTQRKKPNLQWARLPAEALLARRSLGVAGAKAELPNGKRALVCAKCIKKLYK